MTVSAMEISQVQSASEIESFLKFSWQVYKEDPSWVPPILSDSRKFLKGEGKFFDHCEHRLFAAKEEGRIVATLAAFSDRLYQEHWNEKAGFLGFFEALPGKREAVQALFQAGEDYLRELGLEKAYAPFNGQAAYPLGWVEDAYRARPVFFMGYNPEYYHAYLQPLGYAAEKKLIAYQMDLKQECVQKRIREVLEKSPEGVKIRSFNNRRFNEDAVRLAQIYSKTFNRHFGYTPSPEEEFLEILTPFRPILDPDFILFAESEGKTVGFALSVPDYNPAVQAVNGNAEFMAGIPLLFQIRKVKSARLIAIGVSSEMRGKNIAPYLVASLYRKMTQKGYRSCEYSWVLEENKFSRRVAESFYGEPYRNYRVYSKNLKPKN